MNLSEWMTEDWLERQYNQSRLDMAKIEGPNGSQTAGVWYLINAKSLVWYPKDDFEATGYTIPETWDELLALSEAIVDGGGTPWCIGIESGVISGWVATNWTEDLMLRTTSLENYDAWSHGELPFNSPEVRKAIETWREIWFEDNFVNGGRSSIVNTRFFDSPSPLFANPPDCWLHRQATFITNSFPEDAIYNQDYTFFTCHRLMIFTGSHSLSLEILPQ